MAKKSKEKTLDIKNIKAKNKVKTSNNKAKDESTKDNKFDFNEEIVIGLKRIDEKNTPTKNSVKNKKKQKNANILKEGKKQKQSRKNKFNSEINYNRPVKNQVTKKLTPKQELALKKRKAIFRVIKWTSLFLILCGAVVAAILSPIFNVKKVEVIGNEKITSDEIISLSKIELEQNMFRYKKNEIISQIKENPYIENVKVKRKIFDTMQLIIEEREASFKFKLANAYVLINNQGYILEISSKTTDLPIITGIETAQEDIQEGKRLCVKDLKKLNDVLKIMESATSNELANLITSIDISNDDDYVLTLQKKKKIVHLGDVSNLSTKMSWINEFNEMEGNNEGEIMLNMDLDKSKPYFRKKI